VVSTESGPAPAAPERLDHGNHPPQLLRLRDRLGAGPRRLAADVDPVGSFLEQAQAVRERRVLVLRRAAGERVGRDVEDAHHERALAEHHRGAPQRDAE
jgi:hypothetical protein